MLFFEIEKRKIQGKNAVFYAFAKAVSQKLKSRVIYKP